MVERGVVLKNTGSGIDVQMEPSAACDGCNVCFMDKSKLQVLHLDQDLAVNPGEIVEVEVMPGFALKSAFLLFFLPLLMLFGGYFVFKTWLDIPGLSVEYRGALGGIIAMVLTYLGVHYYDRYLQTSQSGKRVKIVRIIK